MSTQDILSITDRLLKDGKPGAAQHAFTAVRTFLRWCVRRRYLQHSPIEGLEPPTKPVSRERVLSDEELGQVLAAARMSGQYGKLLQMLAYTGQRRGEIAAVDAKWVDAERKTITLPKHATKNGREYVPVW